MQHQHFQTIFILQCRHWPPPLVAATIHHYTQMITLLFSVPYIDYSVIGLVSARISVESLSDLHNLHMCGVGFDWEKGHDFDWNELFSNVRYNSDHLVTTVDEKNVFFYSRNLGNQRIWVFYLSSIFVSFLLIVSS